MKTIEQLHDDDLEEMDLKWNMALLSMRARKAPRSKDNRNWNQGSSTKTVKIKDASEKAMCAIDGAGFDWSDMAEEKIQANMALMVFLDSESDNSMENTDDFLEQHQMTDTKTSSFESLLKVDKDWKEKFFYPANHVSEVEPKKVRKNNDAPIIEDWVSDDEDEDEFFPVVVKKQTVIPTAAKIEKPVRKPVRYAEMYRSPRPRGNQRNWNGRKSNQLGLDAPRHRLETKPIFHISKTLMELKFNPTSLVSLQMCDKKNYVLFTDSECLVLSQNFKLPDENQILLKIPRQDNMYSFDMKNIVPKDSLTCLVAKATSEESMLWHRRLGHINFKNINKLVKENLVRDLPLKRFENDQTCVACLKGKQHRASCKTKAFNPITKPLFMLHMDLFGPTFVSSLMHKKYCLVVTDDYSRFSWVFFLTTKDETSEILKIFIKEVENLVDKKVKIIRSDNGTEFKNKVMDDFCREKGIKREYSVARTPQQNGVAERKNRTLIEAARTMLADSKLPNHIWAEAVFYWLDMYIIRALFALRNFDLEDMELESTNSGPTAKLPILKLGEYEMWVIRIKQYLQIQDYALWEVIKNGASWVLVPHTS
ncbi:putative ribonuclease H-like domain-containing protein [Tanacetum coccineum]